MIEPWRWIEVSTIGDLLDRRAAAESADRTAVLIGEDRFTYEELSLASTRFAAGLLALGVGAGDRVGILMHNCADYVLALLGTAKLGAIAVPINARFKLTEASYVIAHAELRVLVTAAEPGGMSYPALIAEVAADGDGLGGAVVVDLSADPAPGFVSREAFVAAAADRDDEELRRLQVRVRVRDIAIIMYTSGTTAKPKGCLLTHEALVRQGRAVAQTRFELTAEDSLWDPLPLFHCGGIVPMLGVFSQGATFCHPGRFEPEAAVRTIAEERCTVLYPAFEAIWLPLVEHPDFNEDTLGHVRLVQNIATPERMEAFQAQAPWASQVTSYGSTECSTNLTMGLASDPPELRLRTLGPVVEGMEVKIVDPENGDRLPDGEMGELCFRGYSCFEGYFKDPELTAAVFDEEGYFHSGDRACLEATGHLRYGGRLKDMIKVGGENVAAIEIEGYLATHPAIRIAQVVSVPDVRYGEVAAAFVEVADQYTLSDEDVRAFCIGRIASYKVPRYVRFVTEWPMSGTKVKKFELQRDLIEELTRYGSPEASKISSQDGA